MALKTINDTNLSAIAAAIREKNQTTNTYKPSEMAEAIKAISTGVSKWGTLYYSANSASLNVSSIVSDYSKIDCIIMAKDANQYNDMFIFFPGVEATVADYTSVLCLTISSSSSVFSADGVLVGPNDTSSYGTYYFKKSQLAENGDLQLFYLSPGGTDMGQMSYAVPAGYKVLVFYHE